MDIEWLLKENDFTKISLTLAFMWVAGFLFILISFPIIAFIPLLFLILLVFTFKKTSLFFRVFLVVSLLLSIVSSWFFGGVLQIFLFPALGALAGVAGVFLDFKHKREQTLSFKAMMINFVLFIVDAILLLIMTPALPR